jgi:hypothetical protein
MAAGQMSLSRVDRFMKIRLPPCAIPESLGARARRLSHERPG